MGGIFALTYHLEKKFWSEMKASRSVTFRLNADEEITEFHFRDKHAKLLAQRARIIQHQVQCLLCEAKFGPCNETQDSCYFFKLGQRTKRE